MRWVLFNSECQLIAECDDYEEIRRNNAVKNDYIYSRASGQWYVYTELATNRVPHELVPKQLRAWVLVLT